MKIKTNLKVGTTDSGPISSPSTGLAGATTTPPGSPARRSITVSTLG